MSIAEEYDYEGLWEYLRNGMIEQIKIVISGTERERKNARRDLYNAAYAHANAKTSESMDAIRKIVSDTIEILRSLAKRKIPFEDKILAAEIEDTVIDHLRLMN